MGVSIRSVKFRRESIIDGATMTHLAPAQVENIRGVTSEFVKRFRVEDWHRRSILLRIVIVIPAIDAR